MKAMLFLSTQYKDIHADTKREIARCNATDYVFVPSDEIINGEKRVAAEAATAMAKAIDALTKNRGGMPTNIWIGTPSVNSKNAWSGYTATALTSFVQSVYNQLEHSKNMVAGIYMNQESIYADMDYNNVLNGSKGGNKEIRIMKQVGDYAKSGAVHGTKFMWCPYYGVGKDAGKIVKNIGHVADKVQIFDYVLLQPQVMFKPDLTPGNLDAVRSSVEQNKVCYRNAAPVIASKVSSTKISYEMEYVAAAEGSEQENRFKEYIAAFSDFKNEPWMFYWQNDYVKAINKINEWH